MISSLYSEKLSSRRFKLLECSIESERTKEHSFSPKINANSDQLSYRKRIQRGKYSFDDNIYESRKNNFNYYDSDNCNSTISKINENSRNDIRSSQKSLNTSQVKNLCQNVVSNIFLKFCDGDNNNNNNNNNDCYLYRYRYCC